MSGRGLDRLAELAALRAARSAARLAREQAAVDALRAEAAALRRGPPGSPRDIEEAIVREGHARWREDRLSRLMPRLARAEAAAQPLREAHARDRAREAVIARLQARHPGSRR